MQLAVSKLAFATGTVGVLYELFQYQPGVWCLAFLLLTLSGAAFICDDWERRLAIDPENTQHEPA